MSTMSTPENGLILSQWTLKEASLPWSQSVMWTSGYLVSMSFNSKLLPIMA